MVNLAEMLKAQRAQAAAGSTTPIVENKEESSHGKTTGPSAGPASEAGLESGTVGTPTNGNADRVAPASDGKRPGTLAGLRLNVGVDSGGTSAAPQRPDQRTDDVPESSQPGSEESHNNDCAASDSELRHPDPAGPVPARVHAPGSLAGLKLSLPPSAPLAPSGGTVAPAVGGPGDSLVALSSDESSGIPTIQSISGFADEIPATAPARELPADMTPAMEAFVKSLDSIYLVMDDPELFAQMIRSIMMDLQSNPQYQKVIADDDVMVMIRGMRESMGLARMRKEEKKRTTTGRKKEVSAKDSAMFDTLASLAGDMGIALE